MSRLADDFPVREEDFQAYVDGLLEADRRATVETWLAHHPEEAERVVAYRAQNLFLHKAFDGFAEEPLSAPLEELKNKLARIIRRRHAVRRVTHWAAAAACLMMVASATWWGYERSLSGPDREKPTAAFARLAIGAHALLTGEASPPLTESGAEGGNALVGWLSQRETKMSRPAPDLKQFGLELSGGRIFLFGERPVVQLIYAEKKQQKLSLYLGASAAGDHQNAFTFVQQGDLATFYWRQPKLEFSLVGRMGRDELLNIAKAVHEQLDIPAPQEGASPARGKGFSLDDRLTRPAADKLAPPSPVDPAGGGGVMKTPIVLPDKK